MKKVSGFLALLLLFSFSTSAFASPNTSINQQNYEGLTLTDFENFEEIPQELLEPGFYSEEQIMYIPEEYLDPYHSEAVGTIYTYVNPGSGKFQTFAIGAAAGLYFIPGIGQILLTATGVLVIGGVTIAAGSWLYNQVAAYFAEKSYEKAKKDGAKTENHSTQSTSTKSSLPTTGKALSSKDLKDSNGVKQRRYYDKNGKADLDIDFRHSGNHKFPHRHTWTNGSRSGH